MFFIGQTHATWPDCRMEQMTMNQTNMTSVRVQRRHVHIRQNQSGPRPLSITARDFDGGNNGFLETRMDMGDKESAVLVVDVDSGNDNCDCRSTEATDMPNYSCRAEPQFVRRKTVRSKKHHCKPHGAHMTPNSRTTTLARHHNEVETLRSNIVGTIAVPSF